MPTELHRRRRFFRNVFHLLLALLTYIIFLLLLYRNSLPQIREKTTVPRQQGNTVVSPDEHEEERPVVQGLVEPFADDWVLPSPQSQASLQPSPGVVWLMSFGGSVRRKHFLFNECPSTRKISHSQCSRHRGLLIRSRTWKLAQVPLLPQTMRKALNAVSAFCLLIAPNHHLVCTSQRNWASQTPIS